MEHDPKVLLMGEDIGKLGGVFRVTDGLQKDFGEDRVIDTPLAESGIIGTAIGLAMRGYRPVCEIQFDGFVYPAFDQIVTQLAKMHARSGGPIRLPVVVRIPFGGGIGAVEHHTESPGGVLRPHRRPAGRRLLEPASTRYWMIQQAIASDDPVIFFEPKRRYWEKARARRLGRPARGAAAPGARRARGHRHHAGRLRADGEGLPGRRVRRGRGRHSASRSSTCARSRRWTSTRSPRRCGAPGGWSSCTRRR